MEIENSEFQVRCLSKLKSARNQMASTTDVARWLKTSRLAVVSAMRALEKRGKVKQFRGEAMFAAQMWALAPCRHERTDEEGICRACGLDCRG